MPASLFPPTAAFNKSQKHLSLYLGALLAQYALELRKLHATSTRQACDALKQQHMSVVFGIVSAFCGGVPPRSDEPITVSYTDSDGQPRQRSVTPIQLARDAGIDELIGNVQISSDPRHEHGRLLSFTATRAVVGGSVPPQYLNVDSATFSQLIVASLKADRPVHVELDTRQDLSAPVRGLPADSPLTCQQYATAGADDGVADKDRLDYASLFGAPITMTKAERLATRKLICQQCAPSSASKLIAPATCSSWLPRPIRMARRRGSSSSTATRPKSAAMGIDVRRSFTKFA